MDPYSARRRFFRRGGKVGAASVAALLAMTAFLAPYGRAQPRADAEPPVPFEYLVKKGDTLIGIGRELLEDPADWPTLQRVNNLPSPRVIQPGDRLLVPRELMRGSDRTAVAEGVGGTVTVDGRPLTEGGTVTPPAWVQTAADSVVTLRLSDGSTLKLAPSSRLRVERLRQYHDEKVLEARMRLEQGRLESNAAGPRRKPMEIRTPAAVAAVRGTEYRVAWNGNFTTSEVLTGAVAMAAEDAQPAARAEPTMIDAGFGAAAVPGRGVLPPERLLPAPALTALPARADVVVPVLTFEPVALARGYHLQVALDPRFTSVIVDQTITEPQIRLATRGDGPHYLRVRAVSAAGIEGYDAEATIDVQARPVPPAPARPRSGTVVFEQQLALGWTPADGATGYQVQVASDPGFRQIVDSRRIEGAQGQTQVQLAPAPGTYRQDRWWRVASVDVASGRIGPYGPVQQLQWRAVPLPGEVTARRHDGVLLRLTDPMPGRTRIEVAADPKFTRPARTLSVTTADVRIDGLTPGVWYSRRRVIDADGIESPWSGTLRFEVRPSVWSPDSAPVHVGDGQPLEITPDR